MNEQNVNILNAQSKIIAYIPSSTENQKKRIRIIMCRIIKKD